MSDGAGGEVSGAVQRAVTCMSMERRVRSGEGGGGAGGYNQALAITCAAAGQQLEKEPIGPEIGSSSGPDWMILLEAAMLLSGPRRCAHC